MKQIVLLIAILMATLTLAAQEDWAAQVDTTDAKSAGERLKAEFTNKGLLIILSEVRMFHDGDQNTEVSIDDPSVSKILLGNIYFHKIKGDISQEDIPAVYNKTRHELSVEIPMATLTRDIGYLWFSFLSAPPYRFGVHTYGSDASHRVGKDWGFRILYNKQKKEVVLAGNKLNK